MQQSEMEILDGNILWCIFMSCGNKEAQKDVDVW